MTDKSFHEPPEQLSAETRNLHRALLSLIEELEAVDWYTQRAEATSAPELAAVLYHHRDEEIEHAMMLLEWIRRHHAAFDEQAARYLFSDESIVDIEKLAPEGGSASNSSSSLCIGSLKSGGEGI